MSRIYTVPIDIADAGTDADQDIFEMVFGSSGKGILHEFEIYSDNVSAASVKLELVSRGSTGSGGTTLTAVPHDPDNGSTINAAVSQGVTTPGTLGSVYKNFWWEQLGPLVYRPAPEDRIVIDNFARIALNLLTNPQNSAIGGYVTWEEF
jgi:hypothetical protein